MPSKAHPSATVLLVRDTPHLMEVFMVVRHHQIDFAAGAMVFPGGRVHASDGAPEVRGRCRGTDGLDDESLSLRVAAIREAFEECAVLLARPRGSDELIGAARLLELDRYRVPLAADELPIAAMLEREDLELACDAMVPFAHWITPEFMPKRFDTHFYLAAAPPDQVAVHDGSESVDSTWITPAAAMAEADAGRRTIIFPTRMNLAKLGRSASVSEALAAARSEPIVTVLPVLDTSSGKPRLRIPAEAGYGITEAEVD